jgi:hypothetical protein
LSGVSGGHGGEGPNKNEKEEDKGSGKGRCGLHRSPLSEELLILTRGGPEKFRPGRNTRPRREADGQVSLAEIDVIGELVDAVGGVIGEMLGQLSAGLADRRDQAPGVFALAEMVRHRAGDAIPELLADLDVDALIT